MPLFAFRPAVLVNAAHAPMASLGLDLNIWFHVLYSLHRWDYILLHVLRNPYGPAELMRSEQAKPPLSPVSKVGFQSNRCCRNCSGCSPSTATLLIKKLAISKYKISLFQEDKRSRGENVQGRHTAAQFWNFSSFKLLSLGTCSHLGMNYLISKVLNTSNDITAFENKVLTLYECLSMALGSFFRALQIEKRY